jgi:flagellar hook-basal body complex protein FliE
MMDVLMKSGLAMSNSFGSMSTQGMKGAESATGDQGSETPFAGLLESMVKQTSALDQQAATAVTGLLSGQGVDIHQAMIATQKADMAFELALQVRNKAVGAYQQMMGMQF